jgi:putative ABC transport system permease protein
MQTLRFAFRMLLKHPAVTLVAVVTLALGIGANTAIFSVVNGVLLKPLPYKDPERLLALWENVPTHGKWRASPANFFDWKKQSTSFEDMAAYGGSTVTLTGQGEPEQLSGANVSSGYFNVLGVHPVLGRSFMNEEHEPGKGNVVVLSDELWQQRFARDPGTIGKTITLDGKPYTVIGVMAPGIYPGHPTTTGRIDFDQHSQQYWLPMSFNAEWAAVRSAHVYGVIGRLKPGVTFEQATTEMTAIGARLEQAYPENKGEGIIVSKFMNELVGDVRPALLILMVAVGLVLLIACANIAGLLLAQHAARSKEIAIRAALGASRMRLVFQFFVEGVLLSLFGAVAGVGLATIGLATLVKFIPQDFPRLALIGIDWKVLAFTLGMSLLTCLIFGLIPAWQASKPDLHSTLEQGGRTSGAGASRLRLRQLLVVGQVSIAVMLVVGAGLLIKSFWLLSRVDPGFQPEHVLSLSINLPPAQYAKPETINRFFSQLEHNLAAISGVQSVGIAYDHPLQTNWVDSFQIEGRVRSNDSASLNANFNPVGPDYFKTTGMRLMKGRAFTRQDDQDHPGVAVVNEAFVRQYFQNEDPIGRKIQASPPARIWQNQKLTSFEIVGVVHDVKSAGLQAASEPTYYLPASQSPLSDMVVLVRTTSEPTSIVPALRQAVSSIDPNQPISNISTMDKIVSDSISRPRLNMLLMGLFGALALILAVVGIYGLLSFAVTQRTQEMGIRMALGAQVSDVVTLVLRQGMTLALIGEVLGLIGAFALTRGMQKLLFGVTPTDASIFIAVVGVLSTTALLACYLPARRAAKVDPLIALKYE